MAISDGQTISDSDLAAAITTQLAAMQADNAQLPAGLELNLSFHGITASIVSSNPERCKCVFVAPFDLYVETVAVRAADFTNPSTLTVSITGDGALASWPITVTGTVGSGVNSLERRLFDNTKSSGKTSAFAETATAFRVFPEGSTITVSLSTTSTATPNTCTVDLVLREFFARE